MGQIVPFFVADRPMSLRLLKGLPLQAFGEVRIGIMAHANTSDNFQAKFADYPCEQPDFCDAVGGPCQHVANTSRCPVRRHILHHTIKMCDSGIFTREGATLNYEQLFAAYKRMGIEYGIMIDVFQDAAATIASAEEAVRIYEPYRDAFRLVGVAQGDTLEEYLDCYAKLRHLGFEHIAVGGLLRRQNNTVRYLSVRSQNFMIEVLTRLRQTYPNDWLFALGCFHPTRLAALSELNVWADYKGWIFQYEKRDQSLDRHLQTLVSICFQKRGSDRYAKNLATLQQLIEHRSEIASELERLTQQLFAGRRVLRQALQALHRDVQGKLPERAIELSRLVTFGLLQDSEERLIGDIVQRLEDSDNSVLDLSRGNRALKGQIIHTEERLNGINDAVARQMSIVLALLTDIDIDNNDMRQLGSEILRLIGTTERSHRFEQARRDIVDRILVPLHSWQ